MWQLACHDHLGESQWLIERSAHPWPRLSAAGPRIIRPIFEHEVRQDGDSVVLFRWVHRLGLGLAPLFLASWRAG